MGAQTHWNMQYWIRHLPIKSITVHRYFLVIISLTILTGCKPSETSVEGPVTLLGEVTVNGKLVDPDLFRGLVEKYPSSYEACPPVSDPYLRDHVLKKILVINEGKRLKLKVFPYREKEMQKLNTRIANGSLNDRKIRIAKAELLDHEYTNYQYQLMPEPDEAALKAAYERALAEKNPRFVNVVLFRLYQLAMVRGTEMGDVVYQALENGESAEKLIRWHSISTENDEVFKGAILLETPDKWLKLPHYHRFSKNWESVTVGDSDGPRNSTIYNRDAVATTYAMYSEIIEKRVIPKVEPETDYPGLDFDVSKEIRRLAIRDQRIEVIGRLFEQADIRVDGVTVDKHLLPRLPLQDVRPNCPRK